MSYHSPPTERQWVMWLSAMLRPESQLMEVVVGSVKLKVSRDKAKYCLDCKLIDSHKIRPLFGCRAYLGMRIVTYLDNDQINKPDTRGAPVYAVEEPGPLSTDQLVAKHPHVIGPGVGRLEGKYCIILDETVQPVQHLPHRVPVPLRCALRDALDDLVQQGILARIQQPTSWVSSMVVVTKKDGKPQICLDPKDLNHYPLPTTEDVATCLHGAEAFTVLDARKGLWHVELEEESSFFTTFNTPFGRYCWKHMPFGNTCPLL